MNADRCNIQLAPRRPLVEGLNVLQNVFKLKAAGRNEVFRQPIEHKSIIRIRRMPQR